MVNPPGFPDTGDDTGGTPRWVKVFGIIALVVVLLFVVLMFTRGPHHGPSRHMRSGDAGGQTPPSSVVRTHAPVAGGRG